LNLEAFPHLGFALAGLPWPIIASSVPSRPHGETKQFW